MTTKLTCRLRLRFLFLLGALTALCEIVSCSGEAPGTTSVQGGTNAGTGGQPSTGGQVMTGGATQLGSTAAAGGVCNSGCKVASTTPGGYCNSTQPVALSCQGPFPSNLATLMASNSCWNVPIDSIAYCCPSAILTTCQ